MASFEAARSFRVKKEGGAMANRKYNYRKALLKDSGLLLQVGILTGSLRSATDRLRSMLRRGPVFLFEAPVSSDRSRQSECSSAGSLQPEVGPPVMLWRVEPDSGGRTARISLLVSPTEESKLKADAAPDPVWLKTMADFIHNLLIDFKYHRIEWIVPADRPRLQRSAEGLGFVKEGCLRGAVAADFFYQDAYLYGLLAPEDPLVRTAFVHFGWFLLEVSGDEDFLKKVEIRPFGSLPPNHVSREALAHLRLLDEEGRVLPKAGPGFSDPGDIIVAGSGCPTMLRQACAELSAYIRGKQVTFSSRLDPAAGTNFQRAVWQAIRSVPYGSVLTYEELAERLLNLKGQQSDRNPEYYARAVGGACGANPFLIFVPCHRIVGKGGLLTGFRGGVENKARLLDFEIMQLGPSEGP